jgi:PAS domain S-box-containing protein
MFEIDLRTLYFSFILLLAVCMGVVFILWYQTRHRFSGMHLLVYYVFAQLMGVTFIAFRGTIPDLISIVIASMFVIGGAILGYVGFEKFVGLKSSYVKHYLLLLVFTGIHVFFTYVSPNQEVRNLNVGASLLIISLETAWLLLYKTSKSMRKVTTTIGSVFVFLVLIGLARVVKFFVTSSVSTDYFHSGLFEAYVAFMYQIAFFLLVFFLALMVNRRLLKEIGLQEEKFSKAFRHSPNAIVISRIDDGQILEVNDGFQNITGYTISDVLGSTALNIGFWNMDADREYYVQKLKEHSGIKNMVMQFRKANGEIMIGEFSSEIIQIDDELCALSVINDITEQKKAEDELRKSQSLLRNFATHLQNAGEEEKIMLATQIDNELNQTLVTLKIDLGLVKQKLKNIEANSVTEDLIRKLDEAYTVIGNSLGFSLKLMNNLRNEVLYMMGFIEALKLYVEEFSRNYPNIKCQTYASQLVMQPTQKQSTTLYRIFESAMSNVAIHSQATEVIIRLHSDENNLVLEIIDNGIGFLYNELMDHTSHGLMLMRERTSLLDGQMNVDSAPGKGTVIRVVIPVSGNSIAG